ncbi:HNH endonuclease signature motif containing protein [Corynebacterium uterequi]|uniref:HNH nuclease domain-containing protein n=1 Tax=Corynebacterium uterequi TaxID=1072256 RepID=A0A0G3HA17_9CORY|nr:HNH endonuclease signature motif containing protein [Corynebacterium uterequi]AKK10144.1 hypothetical protein CUTER_00595 [Corynebacterium uterequi]
MNLLDMIATLQTHGMGLLEVLRPLSRASLTDLGFTRSQVFLLSQAAETFWGRTKHRAKQSRARDAAADGKLAVGALIGIDKAARKLHDGSRFDVLEELCLLRGTTDDIIAQANAVVRERNRKAKDAENKARKRRALRGGQTTDAAGMRTATFTLPERDMADLLAVLRADAEKLQQADPTLTSEQALADALVNAVHHGGGAVPAKAVPLVVISLPDWAHLLNHEGDDTIFGLTDGTTMTGAEVVNSCVSDYHLSMLYAPERGPVNLYRSDRFFNLKQRRMAQTETMVCAVPGCHRPATECHPHHVTAWAQGGDTNAANCAMLCAKHNGQNDDDPNAPPRNGRIERRGADLVFDSPHNRTPEPNRHPMTRYSSGAAAQRHRDDLTARHER